MGILLLSVFLLVIIFIGFKERKNIPTEENPTTSHYSQAELGTLPETNNKIVNCPDCNLGVSRNAKNCPHCGVILAAGKSNWPAITLAVIGALIFFSWLGHTPDSGKNHDQNAAYDACEDYIKPRLKNPSSADFDTANAKVLEPKPDFKTIFLTVRATNSFNAVVPTHYACFVRNIKGIWTVEDIQETEE